MKANTPVWLITGCSTGFGRELAQQAIERGFNVVVTARDVQKVADRCRATNSTRWRWRLT